MNACTTAATASFQMRDCFVVQQATGWDDLCVAAMIGDRTTAATALLERMTASSFEARACMPAKLRIA
jgi:hypothetical protein